MTEEKKETSATAAAPASKKSFSKDPKAEAKFVPLHAQIAEILYLEDIKPSLGKKDTKMFDNLSSDEVKPYLAQAVRTLQAVDKLNLMLVTKKSEAERAETRKKNIETLTKLISEFIKKLKTTKPDMFPCEELAHYLLK